MDKEFIQGKNQIQTQQEQEQKYGDYLSPAQRNRVSNILTRFFNTISDTDKPELKNKL